MQPTPRCPLCFMLDASGAGWLMFGLAHMTSVQIVKAVGIHLVVPLVGVALFALLWLRMKRAAISTPPFVIGFIFISCSPAWRETLFTQDAFKRLFLA